MNGTITIDEKEFEVLTMGKHSSMTHVLFAGGTVEEAESCNDQAKRFWVFADSPDNPTGDRYTVETARLHNIKPLKLIEREPVEFNAEFALIGSHWYPLHTLDDAHGSDNNKKMKFRCVQITEEA